MVLKIEKNTSCSGVISCLSAGLLIGWQLINITSFLFLNVLRVFVSLSVKTFEVKGHHLF